MVYSLGLEATELALVCLEAEYGTIENIRSDNYTTFKSLSQKHKKWHFTAPYSLHEGGLWERSIQTIKRILALYLDNCFSDDAWCTLFAVAESAVNNKPLV